MTQISRHTAELLTLPEADLDQRTCTSALCSEIAGSVSRDGKCEAVLERLTCYTATDPNFLHGTLSLTIFFEHLFPPPNLTCIHLHYFTNMCIIKL